MTAKFRARSAGSAAAFGLRSPSGAGSIAVEIVLPAAAGGATGVIGSVYTKTASSRIGQLLFKLTAGLTLPAASGGNVTAVLNGNTGVATSSGQPVLVSLRNSSRASHLITGMVL